MVEITITSRKSWKHGVGALVKRLRRYRNKQRCNPHVSMYVGMYETNSPNAALPREQIFTDPRGLCLLKPCQGKNHAIFPKPSCLDWQRNRSFLELARTCQASTYTCNKPKRVKVLAAGSCATCCGERFGATQLCACDTNQTALRT